MIEPPLLARVERPPLDSEGSKQERNTLFCLRFKERKLKRNKKYLPATPTNPPPQKKNPTNSRRHFWCLIDCDFSLPFRKNTPFQARLPISRNGRNGKHFFFRIYSSDFSLRSPPCCPSPPQKNAKLEKNRRTAGGTRPGKNCLRERKKRPPLTHKLC